MLKHRIIPVLLWDGKTAVQTTKFTNIRPVGSMEQHIEVMESRNIDEIVILDIAATKEKREPNFELIKRYAGKLFCPVTYGGGVTTIDHTTKLIQECGVDKIAIKTCSVLISKIANKFGSQAAVHVEETKANGRVDDCYTSINRAMLDGAGEILSTHISNNGMKCGYKIQVIKFIAAHSNIPIIANCGGWEPEHMIAAIKAGASAVAASSLFLFSEHTPRSCARALREAGMPVRVDG